MKINKKMMLADAPLHEAGESFLYRYNNDKILKIYKDHIDLKKKEIKIDILLKIDFPKEVVKPIDKIYDHDGSFVGFVMKEIHAEEIRRLFNKRYCISNNINKKYILSILCKIKDVINYLHKKNIIIGDLNDQNILIDKNKVYFIDVDSWHLKNMPCEVAMDLYKDPELKSNNFTKQTDYYAFAILAFRCMVRLHPFGGVMEPDISLTDRMSNRMSVITNDNVKIPSKIDKWVFFSYKFLNDCVEIFDKGKRYFIDSIKEFYDNLTLCDDHNDYYYSKFTLCPVCNDAAVIKVKPEKLIPTDAKIAIVPIFSHGEIRLIFSEDVYLNTSGKIVIRNLDKELNFNSKFYYYSCDNNYYFTADDEMVVNDEFIERITYSSRVVAKPDGIYYIANNYLFKGVYTPKGNYSKRLNDVANNVIFNIYNEGTRFICNIYDNYKVICQGDTFFNLLTKDRIRNYGIHYDTAFGNWLFIYENSAGVFRTYVFNKYNMLYNNDDIRYMCRLGNICINKGIIYIPGDKKITGFNYEANQYKEFPVSVVSEESKIKKFGKKFRIYNEKEIWSVG